MGKRKSAMESMVALIEIHKINLEINVLFQ